MRSRSVVAVTTLSLAAAAALMAAPVAQAAPAPLPASTSATVAGALPSLSPSPRRAPSLAEIVAQSHDLDPRADNPLITFMAGLPRDRTTLDAAAIKVASPGQLQYRDFATQIGRAHV